MAFPGFPLPTNRTNSMPMSDTHPDDHNDVNAAANDLQSQIDAINLNIAALNAHAASFPETSETWVNPINMGITIGTGTVYANHVRIGPLVFCQFRFIQGGTGGVDGDTRLNLPVPPHDNAASSVFGGGWAHDVSTGVRTPLHVGNLTSTEALIRPERADQTFLATGTPCSTTVPHTWAATDQFGVTFTYLAA